MVTDSGRGIGEQPVQPGLGLGNCVGRLEQLYGRDFAFDLRNADGGGARVLVEWPWRQLERAQHAPLTAATVTAPTALTEGGSACISSSWTNGRTRSCM